MDLGAVDKVGADEDVARVRAEEDQGDLVGRDKVKGDQEARAVVVVSGPSVQNSTRLTKITIIQAGEVYFSRLVSFCEMMNLRLAAAGNKALRQTLRRRRRPMPAKEFRCERTSTLWQRDDQPIGLSSSRIENEKSRESIPSRGSPHFRKSSTGSKSRRFLGGPSLNFPWNPR